MTVPVETTQPRGRWAGEVHDFLRLFHHVGRRVFGLGLLQIGWAIFIFSMRTALSLPSGTAGTGAAQAPVIAGISVSVIYVLGAVFWFFVWFIVSGLWWGVRRIVFATVIRPLVWRFGKAMTYLMIAFSAVVDILFALLRWPIARVFNLRVYTLSSDALDRLSSSLSKVQAPAVGRSPAVDAVAIDAEHVTGPAPADKPVTMDPEVILKKLRPLSGQRYTTRRELLDGVHSVLTRIEFELVRGDIVMAAFFGRMPLTDWLVDRISRMYQHVLSSMRIAFSPLIAGDWEEQLAATKAPAQLFAWPAGEVRAKSIGAKSVQFLRFSVLPPLFAVENTGQASRRREWLGLDAIVWGSYARGEQLNLWLHVEQDFRWLPENQQSEGVTASRRIRPFHPFLEIRFSSVLVAANDEQQLYVLLLLILLRSMEIRKHRGWKDRVWGRMFDISAFDSVLREHVIDLLVHEAFLPLGDERPYQPGTVEPLNAVLARTVSQWVGSEIDNDRQTMTRTRVSHLEQIALKCSSLLPQDIETQYRLAALQILLGRAEARVTLRRACALEVPAADERDIYTLNASAMLAFDDLTGLDWVTGEQKVPELWALATRGPRIFMPDALWEFPPGERKWAVFAVLACRAIAQRHERTTIRLAKALHAVTPYPEFFDYESRLMAAPVITLLKRLIKEENPDLDFTRVTDESSSTPV